MHSDEFLKHAALIARSIDTDAIEEMVGVLASCKGRVYIIGLGGSLANAIHMAADLRKLCEIDADSFDNIAEITARFNDDGPSHIFDAWLSRSSTDDVLCVLSVGGGTSDVSPGLVHAISSFRGRVLAIVGPGGGYAALNSDIVLRMPAVTVPEWVTPITEAFQAVVWHCMVSHPYLQKNKTKW